MWNPVMLPVSEAKARLHEVLRIAASRPVMLFRRSRPAVVVVAYEQWSKIHEEIEDLKDRLSVYVSRESPADLRVPLGKLEAELGLRHDRR